MNALGIYSQDGDRLTSMDFRWTLPQELFQQMLQDWLKLPKSKRWPVYLKEHTTMFVYECSGLLFVAFTLENMQPLQVFEALRAITVFLQSAFGGLTEEKVRRQSLAISFKTGLSTGPAPAQLPWCCSQA
jgi:hypothetical protein